VYEIGSIGIQAWVPNTSSSCQSYAEATDTDVSDWLWRISTERGYTEARSLVSATDLYHPVQDEEVSKYQLPHAESARNHDR